MPYFSYYKLITLVDKFVILDDVNFKKKGWINRNQILIKDNAYLFTLPIDGASQNKKINELNFSYDKNWQINFLKTIRHNYIRAPYFKEIYFLLEEIISYNDLNASSFITNSILQVCRYLDIKTEIITSSKNFHNQELIGQSRIIDICKKCGGGEYYNLIGGKCLYNSAFFKNHNITVKFLKENNIIYKQFNDKFVKHLSLIDYLMFNGSANFWQHCMMIQYE